MQMEPVLLQRQWHPTPKYGHFVAERIGEAFPEAAVAAEDVVLDTADSKRAHSEELLHLAQEQTERQLQEDTCIGHIAAVETPAAAAAAVVVGPPELVLGADASTAGTTFAAS